MTETDDHLVGARAAFERRSWAEARESLRDLHATRGLDPHDLEMWSEAAWWIGAVDESLAVSEDAYRAYLDRGEAARASMVALDMAFTHLIRGEEAAGSGWLHRAQRLLADLPPAVEHAYLQSLGIDMAIAEGDLDGAIATARAVADAARSAGDETLEALALVGEGIATIRDGRVGEGLAVVDEAMLAVVGGRVRPTFAGNIYCQLMTVCHELSDVARAGEWTDATARWCEGFEDAVMFIGVCRAHRAQLLGVRGEWPEAIEEVRHVCDDLAAMNPGAIGLALYELGEIRRWQGDLDAAEAAFAEAHAHGADPHPGLASCWAARGRPRQALDALEAAAEARPDRLARVRLAPARCEVALEVGDLPCARAARDELTDAAAIYATAGFTAEADLARGRVALAEDDLLGALDALSSALAVWQSLGAPARIAQTRLLLATAHDALHNPQAAELERAAAAALHRRLGMPVHPTGPPTGEASLPDGLTPREAEVLGLVARGLSNREVAGELVVSEKTVARHLANLYRKLGVTSRTAAAAYAHDHGLVASAPSDPRGSSGTD